MNKEIRNIISLVGVRD